MGAFVKWFGLMGWLLAAGVAAEQSPRLAVAAAADLKYALSELVAAFETQHPSAKVKVIYGSSGKLYEQIASGAPFDLFFAADASFPKLLEEQGLSLPVRLYARGRIVLWSAVLDASRLDLERLAQPDIGHIALANPRHAPYGQRAVQALERAGVWPKVKAKLVFGENVAQAAQFAETGSVEVGIIALSLALSPNLQAKGRYWLVPEELHEPLEQGYVILKRAQRSPLARRFAEFVGSDAARAILRRYGFELP
nr:molybdate transport system substrate-binding protein [uncultured Gammaproteobacteria bacterium]